MSRTARTAIGAAACVCLALAIRVIPSWGAVFTDHGVSFQEPDAWYHMRSIHNLMAHFPKRSGFDPYGLYPLGRYAIGNVAQAPLWDYAVGFAAWVLGAGSPSEELIDLVGAWLPALIGSLFPIPVFFLARRLFGDLTALLSAFWVAIVPGTFLWVTHLGMPDHHAIESFTSFLVLCLVCAASSYGGRGKWWLATAAGVIMGAYLNIRAAGIFVPGCLVLGALVEPALAPIVVLTLATTSVIFLLVSSSLWSVYTWLVLLGGTAITMLSVVLRRIAHARQWSRGFLAGSVGAAAVLAAALVVVVDPAKARGFAFTITRFSPWHTGVTLVDEINELVPLWRSPPGGFRAVFQMFGAAWILGMAGIAGSAWIACRKRSPTRTLFLLWSITMIAGVLFQVRMGAYAGIVVAMLAGLASAWIVERVPANLAWLRAVTAGILIVFGLATTVGFGVSETRPGGGPNADWWSAMAWLRANTPEPMGDSSAWYRFWPALRSGQNFLYPPSVYSVITPWDKGSWVTAIAHRIPDANGAADSGVETARFLTETQPEEALRDLNRTGARYAVLGPDAVTSGFPALMMESGHHVGDYSRVVHVTREDGSDVPLRIYLPAFYQSAAARLYLFDGRRASGDGASVFVTELVRTPSGGDREQFVSKQDFGSETEARKWIAKNPALRTMLASGDPTKSCVDLEELPWAKRVFASSAERIMGNQQPTVVKIFAFRS